MFDGWTEAVPHPADAQESNGVNPPSLQDDDVAFLHDDHTVTTGVFTGMTVINDGTTAGWTTFCTDVLGFAVPPDVTEAGTLAARDLAEMDR